jgi:hypothetical protein
MNDNEIEILSSNPFKNDLLDRRVVADSLTKLIEGIEGSLVLGIDSPWGTGKTTFIKMWNSSLQNNNMLSTLYYNAWENDDFDDPLLAIIGAFDDKYSIIEKNKLENIKKICVPLLKKALPIALKVATHGLLDIQQVSLGNYNEEQITELAGTLGELEFKRFNKEKRAKEELKKALVEFQKNQDKKIVIFLDELDRCRPSFAIDTLERIKHLFDIPNYIFVLSLDKTQLSHSIATVYGNNMDSIGYLRRFIDIDYILPPPDRAKYIKIMARKFNLISEKNIIFWDFIEDYIILYDFSLRDIDKLVYYMRIFFATTPFFNEQHYKDIFLYTISVLYSLLIILKIKDIGLYRKIISQGYNENEVAAIVDSEIKKINLKVYDFYSLNSNYRDIMYKFLKRNVEKDIIKNQGSYIIGPKEDIFDKNRYDMNDLWDSNGCKILKQLDFLENFISE